MGGTGKYILGTGEVVTPKSAREVADLKLIGVTEATPEEVKHDSLKQQYSSWLYAPTALASGVVEGAIPGAMGAAITGADATGSQAGSDFSQGIEGSEAAFPWTNRVGMGVGMVAGLPIKGFAAVGALGKAAYAAGRGAVQAVGMTFDQRAMEHIESPEGAEKVAAVYFRAATLGAVTGGVFSWVGGKLAAGTMSKAGETMEAKGAAAIASKAPLNNPGVVGRLEQTGATSEVQQFMTEHGLDGAKSMKEIRSTVRSALKSSSATIKEEAANLRADTKASAMASENGLTLQEHAKFSQTLRKQLVGTDAQEAIFGAEAMAPQSLAELQSAREMLFSHKLSKSYVGAATTEAGQALPKYEAAIQTIDSYMDQITEAAKGIPAAAHNAERFAEARVQYKAARALQDALKYSEDTGKSFLSWAGHKMASAGATGALFSGVSGNPGGIAAGLGMAGAGKALQASEGAGARLLQGAGKFTQAFDDQVVQRIVTGLGERSVAGQVGGAAAAKVLELGDYTTTHAYVSWASENPTLAVPRMAQALEEQGVPGPLIDSAIPQTIVGVQYLASVRPQSPWTGQTVAPLDWQPDLHEKALFLDRANTVMNPLQALQDLTPERAETLRAVYPILAQNVANIAAQEAATRPDLSRKARQWVSLLTGVPASPLDSPQSQAILAMLDAQQSQPAQATRQQTQGSHTSIGSTPTRLDRLSSKA